MATSFMNIELPTVSVTIGPDWANSINTAIETIDAHDHTSDKGVKIPTAGLNINANLSFETFAATSLLKTNFSSQTSALSGSEHINSVHVVSGNLYFTNNSGTAVQLTDGGSVISAAGAIQKVEVQPVASDLIINPSDSFVFLTIDTTAIRTITLPLASNVADGRIYIIKDKNGQSLDNPITITVQGLDTIDSETSIELNSNYGSWWVVRDTDSTWTIA